MKKCTSANHYDEALLDLINKFQFNLERYDFVGFVKSAPAF